MVNMNNNNILIKEGREFLVNYKSLNFYTDAHELTLEIYKLTKDFPKEELYGLASQLKRASVSICSNIAEGSGKGSRLEFRRFINISIGSAKEVEYQLLLSKDLGYISIQTYDRINNLVSKVIGKMFRYMERL